MKVYALLLGALAVLSSAESPTVEKRASNTVVIPKPDATYVGVPVGIVESFQGLPFAQPPTGDLRFAPPKPLDPNVSLGKKTALTRGTACPQHLFETNALSGLPQAALGVLLNSPLFQKTGVFGEDCLYLNVYRPAGVSPDAKLPVLFWMHGGGFTMGFTMDGEGVPFVTDSITQGKPIIFVAATYRSNAFGFLGGKEVLAAGEANWGLLDQRQAMRWVADNIASFGGDPDKVTIWGESAGAISVFDHLILYDGDNTYNGKPLFRSGIMNSGSLVPADPVDTEKAQYVFDRISLETGCDGTADRLACLRQVPYDKLLNSVTRIPTFTGYQSIALRFMPRPDGKSMTASPEVLMKQGKFARVPVIIGDEEDEGTLWSLMQPNLTTKAEVQDYLKEYFFHHASDKDMQDFVGTYQTITEDGSPFRTGLLNNWYPQYKRLAAILGDLAFTLSRRYFLNERWKIDSGLKAWSYMSSYNYGTPILGSVHGGDIIHIVLSIPFNYATRAIHGYYLSFIYDQDPNSKNILPNWPEWKPQGGKLLNMYQNFQQLIGDDFRSDSYEWIASHVPQLTM